MSNITCPNCGCVQELQITCVASGTPDKAPIKKRPKSIKNKDGATLLRELAAGPMLEGGVIITTPQEAYEVLKDMQDLKKEHFVALYFDGRRRLLLRETISIGTLTSTLVHPREVFQPAIACSAGSLMVAHNHPSGNPQPSPEDIVLTRRLRDAGRLLGIELIDHLIIGKVRKDEMGFRLPGFVSLKQSGDL